MVRDLNFSTLDPRVSAEIDACFQELERNSYRPKFFLEEIGRTRREVEGERVGESEMTLVVCVNGLRLVLGIGGIGFACLACGLLDLRTLENSWTLGQEVDFLTLASDGCRWLFIDKCQQTSKNVDGSLISTMSAMVTVEDKRFHN